MDLLARLRSLRDALPPSGSVTFTRADLDALLSEESGGEADSSSPPVDYTTDDLMEATGRCRSTVTGWINRGELRAYRFGREWRVPPAAWREFLERHRNGEADQRPHLKAS